MRAEDGITPVLLFTENETNTERLFGVANSGRYVKDGIDDAIVHGLRDRVNEERGTKVAAHVHALVDPGSRSPFRSASRRAKARPFVQFDAVMSRRLAEADEFYAGVQAPHLTDDERRVQRQAYARLLWSKQFYHYDVHHWLAGDAAQPAPPRERWQGRNRDWALHFHNADIV